MVNFSVQVKSPPSTTNRTVLNYKRSSRVGLKEVIDLVGSGSCPKGSGHCPMRGSFQDNAVKALKCFWRKRMSRQCMEDS